MHPRTTTFAEEICSSVKVQGEITENESREANDEIDSTDNDEDLLDTGICNPIIDKEGKRKCQSIFEEVDLSQQYRKTDYCDKSFRGKSTMRIDHICINWNRQIYTPHSSESVQNDRNNPS